jgi:hypothetical protein
MSFTDGWTVGEIAAAEHRGAARERARIRRLIGPALRDMFDHIEVMDCEDCKKSRDRIDAATRPESKRKAKVAK